jgi:phosphorylcholine metabolism protein LicD
MGNKVLNKKQLAYVHSVLKQNLKIFTDILSKYDYKYFIQGGTLLGSVRCANIIPHDDDVDIGLWSMDLQRLSKDIRVHTDLSKHNLKICSKKKEICYKLKCIECPHNIFIDIFSFELQEDGKLTMTTERCRELWPYGFFYINEVQPLKSYRLGSDVFLGPHNPLPYLKRMYGDDWKTPQKTNNHISEISLNKNCYGKC